MKDETDGYGIFAVYKQIKILKCVSATMIVFDAFTSNMQFLIVSYIHNTRMEILPDDKDKL